MAIAPLEHRSDTGTSLEPIRNALAEVAEQLSCSHRVLSADAAARTLVDVEDISRIVDHLQVLGRASRRTWTSVRASRRPVPVRSRRGRNKRSGTPVGVLMTLSGGPGSGTVRITYGPHWVSGGQRASSVRRRNGRWVAAPEQLVSMGRHLTLQAPESDEDVLRVLARRWETVLDHDGREPTEKLLRACQGVFFRGRGQGPNILEVGATDEQFEQLLGE